MLRIRIEAKQDAPGYLVRGYDGDGFRWQEGFKCMHDVLTFIAGFFKAVRMQDEQEASS